MSAVKYHLIEPNETDIEFSKKMSRALESDDTKVLNSLLADGNMSGSLKEAILAIFETLAEGNNLAIAPSEKVMSSQEAANFLNVSRPHINKLLDSGVIPSYRDGKHRRVYFKDLIFFKVKRESAHKGLAELSEQAQKLEMGW